MIEDTQKDSLHVLLIHAVRLSKITESIVKAFCKASPFADYKDLNLIWTSAREYWVNIGAKEGKTIPKVWLVSDVKGRVSMSSNVILDDILVMIDEIFSTSMEDLGESAALEALRSIRDASLLSRVSLAVQDGSDDAITQARQALAQHGKSLMPRERVINNVLGSGSFTRLKTMVKETTGVDLLDELLNGGLSVGEKLGFVIPTGNGKTTLALQMADGTVRRNCHVAYISTEQGLNGDIQQRIFTLAASSAKDIWSIISDSYDPSNPDPEQEVKILKKNLSTQEFEEFEAARAQWNEYFHFFDFTDTDSEVRSFDEIFQTLKAFEAEHNIHFTYVYLDWWGALRGRIVGNVVSKGEQAVRDFVKQQFNVMADRALTYQWRVVVFQQMKGGEIRKSQKQEPSGHDAQNDSNFPDFFDYCFASSQLDTKTKQGRWASAKVRTGAGNVVKVWLDGAHCKFRPAQVHNEITTMKSAQRDGVWI